MGALEAALGRSKRQIQRIMAGKRGQTLSAWERAVAALERAAQRVAEAEKHPQDRKAKALIAAVKGVLEVGAG